MKLLLHTCCGPCFLGVYEGLKDKNIEITNFYSNSNIWPEEEYLKRKENLIKVVEKVKTNFIEDDYSPEEYESVIKDNKDFPKRCLNCYKLRLTKTAKFAKVNGFDYFSTTLLVSPYQDHDSLKKIGENISKELGIDFYYSDFRDFFRKGQNIAKNDDLYRQKYCGCKYSKITTKTD